MDIEPIPFAELSGIVDRILEDCDEDVVCTRMRLSALDPEIRDLLLTSDLLNAWQVFFYYFQEIPGDEALEILAFNPASTLTQGLLIGEFRDIRLTFSVHQGQPVIRVSNDEQELRRFSGTGGYRSAMAYIDSDE